MAAPEIVLVDARPLQGGVAGTWDDVLQTGRIALPGVAFHALIDPTRPPLASFHFDAIHPNAYAAGRPHCLVRLSPDDPLFIARLIQTVPSVAVSPPYSCVAVSPPYSCVPVSPPCPAGRLEQAVAAYWWRRSNALVEPEALWSTVRQVMRPSSTEPGPQAVFTTTPTADPAAALRARGASVFGAELVPLLSSRFARTLFILEGCEKEVALLTLLRRYGGDVLLTGTCLLPAYGTDAGAAALASVELGRDIPPTELAQWRAGIARPGALFLGEVAAASRDLFVPSIWAQNAVRTRFGRDATIVPIASGAPPPAPQAGVIAAAAAGLQAEACVWAVELLRFWGREVRLVLDCPIEERPALGALAARLGIAVSFNPEGGAVTAWLGMRGTARSVAGLVASLGRQKCVASQGLCGGHRGAALARPRARSSQPPLAGGSPAGGTRRRATLPSGARRLVGPARTRRHRSGADMIRLDISKLVDDPRRSGIQRVERELIRHWPDRDQLSPCRFDPTIGELRTLPKAVLDLLCTDAPPGGTAAERDLLAPLLASPGAVVRREGLLFTAELFDDPARAAFHQAEAAHAAWLVYDFLPWLRPEWFPAGPANRLMPYLHAMRSVARRSFISATTRRDCAALFRRDEPGPILSLGADGLDLEPQLFHRDRRDIVVLGTIEARKNVLAAIAAAEMLWRDGIEFRLVLIGALEPDALAEQATLRRLEGETRLIVLGSAADETVRDCLRQARALLFPSQGEGYGLPPMEALYCGIPAIVAADLPALDGISDAGQIRLPRPDAPSVARALRTVFDDDAAKLLWAETAGLELGSWRDFATGVASWLNER